MDREQLPSTPEFRRFENGDLVKQKDGSAHETVEEFLARGGAINVIPTGVGSEVPIIVSKQPDGTIRNDWHQQEKSRKRKREPSGSFVVFERPKVKVGKSGRAYIRVTVTDGARMYMCRIQGENIGEWTEEIEVAVKVRNEKLCRMNIQLPD